MSTPLHSTTVPDSVREQAVARLQGEVEGVPSRTSRVEFMGSSFRVASKVGIMPLMKFAAAADAGIDTSDMAALSAIYAMLRDCIQGEVPACGKCDACMAIQSVRGEADEVLLARRAEVCPYFDKGDWYKFELHAIEKKADAEDLLPVATKVVEILTARPTS